MSNENSNVALLKKIYARWNETKGGSVDDIFSILDENVSWGSVPQGNTPQLSFARAYSNKQALRSYFDTLTSEWSMIHYTIKDYVAQGDAVVAIGSCSWTHKKTGKTVDTPKADIWRFKDGKATEFFEYFDTAQVVLAATP